jgi:membrane-associated phospholipid phosphatase
MPVPAGIGAPSNYFSRLGELIRLALLQLVRRPQHLRRTEAARRLLRQIVPLAAIGGVVIIALMVGLDANWIGLMPARGTAGLWPVRILTDFGKDAYVLWSLAAALILVAVIAPGLRGTSRSLLLGFGTRLQFVFFAVLAPVLAGAVIKWSVGRGRPFVGGQANAFTFEPFKGSEAYASLPSSHAVTAFALAFAVAAIWPRLRAAMIVYALLIAASRLALLAHHPSDVVAGALIGVVGAMLVRYWFAARRLGFTIRRDGEIVPLGTRPSGLRKKVARGASAP